MARSYMAEINPRVSCRHSNDVASLEKARNPYKIETELRPAAYKTHKDCRAASANAFSRERISPRAPARTVQ
jgi:hypothetical protein